MAPSWSKKLKKQNQAVQNVAHWQKNKIYGYVTMLPEPVGAI